MTIKKRLLLSNILMIVVPVLAALAAGACCIALLWLMLRIGNGLPLEDSGEFSWASRAVVKPVAGEGQVSGYPGENAPGQRAAGNRALRR